MHSRTTAAAAPEERQPPPAPLQPLLDLITSVLSLLLVSSLTVRSFVGKWQILHPKLVALRSSLFSLSNSPHWSQNPLLHTLLPSLLSTLQRLNSLSDQCAGNSFAGGKLLMQSDLDMAASSLSSHISNLDLLLRSGVLHLQDAIVLSHPPPTSDKEDLAFFVRDLFTRLQIGGTDFKRKSLESLIQLLTDSEKSAGIIAREGDLRYLVNLLDLYNEPVIRELAVVSISLLTSSSVDSRKIVFEEGGLGPLIRILETGSLPMKEKSSIAIEAITADPDNAWAISAYSGVSVLIEACRSGSQVVQDHAAGAIRNSAAVEDVRTALAEEGAVPVLLHLLDSGAASVQEKAASFIAILASSGDCFHDLIIQEKGLLRLMHLIEDSSSPDTIEHVLVCLSHLSASDSVSRVLSSSTGFIVQLGELIKHGNLILQQISSSLLARLEVSDGNKRAISSCISSLIRLMGSPKPAGLQESAAYAAASLLTVRSNRKEFAKDEKSVMRLVQMLNPRNEMVAAKELPVVVALAALAGGSHGFRKHMLAAGADKHLQMLSEMEVPGAKRAMQRLAGNRLKSILSRAWRE